MLKFISLIISCGTAVLKVVSDHGVTFGSAVDPTTHNALIVHNMYIRLLTAAKTWYHCGLDALVNTSVICTDLKLEFGGKTIAALSVVS